MFGLQWRCHVRLFSIDFPLAASKRDKFFQDSILRQRLQGIELWLAQFQ